MEKIKCKEVITLKKKLALLAAIAITAISFASCAGTAPVSSDNTNVTASSAVESSAAPESSSEAETSAPADEAPTDDECINTILPDLLTALNDIDFIGACAVTCDSAVSVDGPVEGVKYSKVTDPRFSSLADLDSFLNTYLTPAMRASRYSGIMDTEDCIYIEKDGVLYVAEAGRGCGFNWTETPAVISDKTVASFTATKEYDDFGAPSNIKLNVVKGENGWLIDGFEFIYSEDSSVAAG